MRKLIPLLFCLTACINGGPRSSATPDANTTTTPATAAESSSGESGSDAIQVNFSEHPTVNVYLETSGSMNGYVDSGKSQFQQVVFDFLSNIKNSGLPSEMNLNYITDTITARGSDVDPFINSLTSRGLLSAAGNKATTDIAALIAKILPRTNGSTLSIFISDCIFSPGSVSNPTAYLENQKIAIRNAVKEYIDANNGLVGCSVYQIYSQFRGSYFDFKNRRSTIDMQRPFYIWVFGSPVHIATIKSKVPDSQFMGSSVANTWTIVKGDFSGFDELNDYGLLQPSPTNGSYRWVSKNEVAKIKINGNQFIFTFGVDLGYPILLYGEDYATDLNNYKHIITKETDEEFFGSFRKNMVSESPYTHDITVISDKPFTKGTFTVVFDGTVPGWVNDCHDMDDSILDSSNSHKTYGFKYMCEGIHAGFHANNSSNITARYDFEIK